MVRNYLLLALVLIAVSSVSLAAQTYTLKWNVVAAGGTDSNFPNGSKLRGTVVQTAIGSTASANYIVGQGFWQSSFFCRRGDADGNSHTNITDAVYIINYIFAGGREPVSDCNGDADGNGYINISDAVTLIQYIFLF
ncbi:MAG: dockerin type I repeat-containing protein [Candidatus Zixiibacteriota bacterium]